MGNTFFFFLTKIFTFLNYCQEISIVKFTYIWLAQQMMVNRLHLLFVLAFCCFSFARSSFSQHPIVFPEFPDVDNFNVTGLSAKCSEQILDISVTRPADYQQSM